MNDKRRKSKLILYAATLVYISLSVSAGLAQTQSVSNGKQARPADQRPINLNLPTLFVIGDSKGDFVLIQFGHNDAGAINDASRARGSLPGTGEETQEIDNQLNKKHEVVHTYGWYMRKMIADTKAKGATPIVLSLTVRNIWKDGHVERGPGKFGQWAAEVAKSQYVTFIDVTTLIADRYEKLGEERVKELFATDHTHTSPAGAELNASLVVTGLKMLKDKPLNRYLTVKDKAVENSRQ